MKVWDLHCDTLSALRYAENDGRKLSFENNDLMIDFNRLKQGDYLLQCFACFVNFGRKNENPLQSCLEMIDIYHRLLDEFPELMPVQTPADVRALAGSGKIGAMLTVEEGAVCLDDVRMLRNLYRLGVRMMTLTWNYDNGLAHPNTPLQENQESMSAILTAPKWPMDGNDAGLTEKGIEFVREMNRLHMIIDVAHLSDGGIWDVFKYSEQPFAASHSNARAVTGHARNLTDDMIRQMGEKGCLIGLNYCGSFLDSNPDRDAVKSRMVDMIRHAKHIIDIGGEDVLALGSDFDGIEGDLEIAGAQDMPKLADAMLAAGFSTELVEKIFYKNAMRFFEENL